MKKLLLVLLLASTALGMHTGVMQIPIGAKDVSLHIKMYDPGDNGTLEPGLTVTDFDLYYIRVEKDNDVTIDAKADMAALNALTDAHTDDKALEIGQGYYRIDVPDGAFAAGATRGAIIVSDDGAAALTTTIDFELIGNIQEWHIAKSGFDTNGGHSFEDAFLTIGQAITVLDTANSTGDTIIIHPGTYVETVDLIAAALTGITLQGFGAGSTKIATSDGVEIVMLNDDCVLRDLMVENTSGSLAVHANAKSRTRIENCHIKGTADAIKFTDSIDNYIVNCVIEGPEYGVHVKQLTGSCSVIIKNCHIYSNGWTTCSSSGIENDDGYTLVDNCIIRVINDSTGSTYGSNGVNNLNAGVVIIRNSHIYSHTNDSDATGVGVSNLLAGGVVIAENCVIKADDWDAQTRAAGDVILRGCFYDSAKVREQSGGTVTQVGIGWAAAVNAEMDTAFNTAVPGSPTADSINERIATMDDKLPSKTYLMGSADSDGGFDTEAKADINTALSDYDVSTEAGLTDAIKKSTVHTR